MRAFKAHNPPAPVYSIIVPAYNEAAELPPTLRSIRLAMKEQELPGECIVVDNNSTDSTAEVATTHGADCVVSEPVNQIARARNAGAKASRGRFLIFVDADTRISPGLLRESLGLLGSGEYVGGGSLVHFEEKAGWIGALGIRLWGLVSRAFRIAAGSYLFCHRGAFEAVGGFDETLYASEEVRFSRLLKKWGRRRRQKFVILQSEPVQTSARKLEWHSGPRIIGLALLLVFLPPTLRSRRWCAFWYERPVRPAAQPSEPKDRCAPGNKRI